MNKFRKDCCSFQGIDPHGDGSTAICNEANGEYERIKGCHEDCFRYLRDPDLDDKKEIGISANEREVLEFLLALDFPGISYRMLELSNIGSLSKREICMGFQHLLDIGFADVGEELKLNITDKGRKYLRKNMFEGIPETARELRRLLGGATEKDKEHYRLMRSRDEKWIDMRNAIFNMEQKVRELQQRIRILEEKEKIR